MHMEEILVTLLIWLGIVAGVLGLLGVPFLLWQLFRRKVLAVRADLPAIQRFFSTIGLIALVPVSFLWVLCVSIIGIIVWRGGPAQVWGMSEVVMTLDFLGWSYIVIELMLLPITIRQIRSCLLA